MIYKFLIILSKMIYIFKNIGGYAVVNGENVLQIIEVIDDINKANLEEIRSKYLD